jgi:hypothetical protein
MIYLPPLTAALFGTALLYRSWRRSLPNRALTISIGWMFLFGSLPLWVYAAGSEFGSVFAIIAVPFAAWLFVGIGLQARDRVAVALPRRRLHGPSLRAMIRQLGLFAATVPLAGAASSMVSAALVRWLPGLEVDRMAFAVLIMPVVWGLLAFWICAAERRLRTISLIAGLGIVSALLAGAG